jgi:hypothetical protein
VSFGSTKVISGAVHVAGAAALELVGDREGVFAVGARGAAA